MNGYSSGSSRMPFRITLGKNMLADAIAFMGKRERRKIANNTYMHKGTCGASVKVRLHSTDILVITAKGVVLNSGGYRTILSKDRMNALLPVGYSLYSEKGLWTLRANRELVEGWNSGTHHAFADGITITNTGRVLHAGNSDKDLKLRKQIHAYVKAYAAEAVAGRISAPSGGDCWGCLMFDKATGINGSADPHHILEHMSIQERYYVPSLLVNAAKARGNRWLLNYLLPLMWDPTMLEEERKTRMAREAHSLGREIKRTLRQYLGSRLGIALR
jgi:hypothetical protein